MNASRIAAALHAACRPADPAVVAVAARALAAAPTLDSAIAQASHDGSDAAAPLLAYRAALREGADPARLLRRLTAEAEALDRRAEALAAEAAEFFGKAAHRAAHGPADLAADFQVRAEACEAAAAELQDQAFAKRLAAAGVEARQAQARALVAVAGAGR